MDVIGWLSTSGAGGGSSSAGWIAARTAGSDGTSPLWGWVTVALSAAVAAGYVAIAVNWHFQQKLAASRRDAYAAVARLVGLVVCGAACGYVFYATEMAWRVWRLYDAVLLLLAWRTWTFALRMRGIGLVDARLAEVDELERSAKKFREIAELLPHMVWTATGDGTVDFSNRQWAAYAGPERTWLDAAHPDDRKAAHDWWTRVVARREPAAREVRLHGVAADEFRTFLVKVTPIVHGELVKWLGACADIEDQKLVAAEKELQAKQKTFFLNALSHDLRAPLNNVVLHAHLLRLSASLDAGDGEVADLIVENAQAAGDLVTKLLEYAKAGAAGDQNVLEPVDVSALLGQVVRRFNPTAERRGLQLTLREPAADDEGAGEMMMTDRLKLERVVANLVDNALKYTEQGGVTIEWSTKPMGSVGHREEGFSVAVTDTGIGVPPQNVPRLFDEFYQVNNHERDRSKGFGMGLAICRSLARQLGGDVKLAPEEVGLSQGAASRLASQRYVLVVEDDHTARRAITLILGKRGFVASEAATVAEALSKLRARRPEWILLDLMLPDGYGTEVLRAVRSEACGKADDEEGVPPPRVCVITGCGADLVTEARLLGAEQVLTKPVDVQRLLDLLAAAPVV